MEAMFEVRADKGRGSHGGSFLGFLIFTTMFLKAPRAKITINMQKRFWGKKFPKGLALGFWVKMFKSWISLKLCTLGFFDLLNINLLSDFAWNNYLDDYRKWNLNSKRLHPLIEK